MRRGNSSASHFRQSFRPPIGFAEPALVMFTKRRELIGFVIRSRAPQMLVF